MQSFSQLTFRALAPSQLRHSFWRVLARETTPETLYSGQFTVSTKLFKYFEENSDAKFGFECLIQLLEDKCDNRLGCGEFQWNGVRENFQQTIVFGLQRIKFHHVACFFSLLHLRCILQYGLHTPVWKLGKKWPKKWLAKSAAKLVTNKNLSKTFPSISP